jgi:hypothetical protein
MDWQTEIKTNRKTNRQTGRTTKIQKGRKAERQKGRKAERQKGRKAERQKGRKAEQSRQTNCQFQRQKETGEKRNEQTNRQMNWQTDSFIVDISNDHLCKTIKSRTVQIGDLTDIQADGQMDIQALSNMYRQGYRWRDRQRKIKQVEKLDINGHG